MDHSRKCDHCGEAVGPRHKFCFSCGKPIQCQTEKTCQRCGSNLKEEEKFCHECGSSVTDSKDRVAKERGFCFLMFIYILHLISKLRTFSLS